MTTGRMLLAVVVGGVVYFLLGWLVWGILLQSVFALAPETAAMIQRNPMNMVAMFGSCLAWAGLLTFVFARWAGITTFVSGATAGAILGGLVSLTVDLGMMSQYNFYGPTQILADVVANAGASAIVGGVVAWVLNRSTKA